MTASSTPLPQAEAQNLVLDILLDAEYGIYQTMSLHQINQVQNTITQKGWLNWSAPCETLGTTQVGKYTPDSLLVFTRRNDFNFFVVLIYLSASTNSNSWTTTTIRLRISRSPTEYGAVLLELAREAARVMKPNEPVPLWTINHDAHRAEQLKRSLPPPADRHAHEDWWTGDADRALAAETHRAAGLGSDNVFCPGCRFNGRKEEELPWFANPFGLKRPDPRFRIVEEIRPETNNKKGPRKLAAPREVLMIDDRDWKKRSMAPREKNYHEPRPGLVPLKRAMPQKRGFILQQSKERRQAKFQR
jgi:hypothetical protein